MTRRHYRLTKAPLDLVAADYEVAADEIDARLAGLPGAVAVFGFGNVGAPGISDLDRVVVLEQPAAMGDIWNEIAPASREVAMHTPFAVDVATFERSRWFSQLNSLVLLRGSELRLEEEVEDQVMLDRVLAVEGMLATACRVIKQCYTGRIKVRSSLCELHALKYSLALAGLPAAGLSDASNLVDDVQRLRQEWFLDQPDREVRLLSLLERAGPALYDALLATSRDGPPYERGGLRLAGPWRNVSLVPGTGKDVWVTAHRPGRSPVSAVSNRSHRLAEAAWRTKRFRLPVPCGSLGLIAPPAGSEMARLLAYRHSVVHAYSRFLEACGGGWSRLGFAHLFPASAVASSDHS
jgi:hypothetical protein